MAKPDSVSSYWTCLKTEIDTHLKQAILVKPPLVVYEPMHRLTMATPHFSAPALCLASCELLCGRREHALAAAAALRLMQAAAFIHENLLLTGSHLYEPNMELLMANGMMPFGFELLAGLDNGDQLDPGRVLRVVIEISNAMGSQGVIGGQYKELQYEKSMREDWLVDGTWANEVCRKKEGKIHGCAGACGAILGGGNEDEIEKMRKCGVYVGIIRGILKQVDETKVEEETYFKEINELRKLAVKELEHFSQHNNFGVVSSLLDNKFY